MASCVAWASADELFSVADDHVIQSWNLSTMQSIKIATLPNDVYPTDVHWVPKHKIKIASKVTAGQEFFILGATDGSILNACN